MIITMTIGAESRSLDLATMPIKDAQECERLTGWTWTEWRNSLAEDRANAVAYAWYLAGRRAGLEVGRFGDIDIDLAKLRWTAEMSDEEKQLAEAADSAADEDEDPDLPTGPVEAATRVD